MSDDVSVSYSYSPNPDSTAADAARTSEASEPMVAFADCELIPVDQRMTLVINRQNGEQQLISPQVIDALKACTFFDTINRHTERLCSSLPTLQGREEMVGQTLRKLTDDGILLKAETLCSRLNKKTEQKLPPTRVFVITCDRPSAVERLLQSMLHAGGLSRHESLYLIDDSRDETNQLSNRELVEKFNITSAKSMSYVGSTEQDALMEHLIGASPQHEKGIRFLLDKALWLDKPTYGRSRTLCLLHSVGFRAIVLDDDILCQAMRPVVQQKGVYVGSGGQREAAFFPDRDTLMSVAVPAGESPLDIHARHLGATLCNAITGLNEGELQANQLAKSNAAMVNLWQADTPILVTQCGSWGDPGTADSHWVVNLDRVSVERMLAAPTGMASSIESRCVWLGVIQPTVLKMAFMSQMTGLDNSALLPPYFPVFRGEDLLFAAMVEALHPKGAVVEYDFAVPHLPEERQRKSLRDPIAKAGSVGLFASYLTNRIDYTDDNDPSQRLSMVAQDLRRIADKGSEDLLLDYRRELAVSHASQLMQVRRQLGISEDVKSANWEGYLKRAEEELLRALQRNWSPTDIDGVSAETSPAMLMESLRGLLRGFADALDAWEAMRSMSTDYSASIA